VELVGGGVQVGGLVRERSGGALAPTAACAFARCREEAAAAVAPHVARAVCGGRWHLPTREVFAARGPAARRAVDAQRPR